MFLFSKCDYANGRFWPYFNIMFRRKKKIPDFKSHPFPNQLLPQLSLCMKKRFWWSQSNIKFCFTYFASHIQVSYGSCARGWNFERSLFWWTDGKSQMEAPEKFDSSRPSVFFQKLKRECVATSTDVMSMTQSRWPKDDVTRRRHTHGYDCTSTPTADADGRSRWPTGDGDGRCRRPMWCRLTAFICGQDSLLQALGG